MLKELGKFPNVTLAPQDHDTAEEIIELFFIQARTYR